MLYAPVTIHVWTTLYVMAGVAHVARGQGTMSVNSAAIRTSSARRERATATRTKSVREPSFVEFTAVPADRSKTAALIRKCKCVTFKDYQRFESIRVPNI